MQKRYNSIPIEDYYVVVGELATEHDKYFLSFDYPNRPKLEVEATNAHGMCSCKKIIATIGKRIGDLPLIEIPNEIQQYAIIWNNEETQKFNRNWNAKQFLDYRLKKHLKEDANTEYLLQATKLMIAIGNSFAFQEGYKAATKLYSEEDMLAIYKDGARDAMMNLTGNGNETINDLADRLFKDQLLELKAKPIIAVELELIPKYSGLQLTKYEQEYLLKVDENNIIIPVNTFYE